MKAEIILSLGKKEKAKIKEMLSDLQGVTNAKEIKESEKGFNVEFI